jgi:hypothetical protein
VRVPPLFKGTPRAVPDKFLLDGITSVVGEAVEVLSFGCSFRIDVE